MKLIQDLEDDLAASDATLERHGMKLQNLDFAMQMLRAVTGELEHGESDRQVIMARLGDLRMVCAQAFRHGLTHCPHGAPPRSDSLADPNLKEELLTSGAPERG